MSSANILTGIVQLWDHFFFKAQDLLPLVTFRILFGIILFFDSIYFTYYAPPFFGKLGVAPWYDVRKIIKDSGPTVLSYIEHSNSLLRIFFFLQMVFSIGLIVGFQTRFCIFMLFIGTVSRSNRNMFLCNSSDSLTNLLLFLLFFSNCNADWALDQLSIEVNLPNVSGANWAWRLMQIQVCIVYLYSAIWKWKSKIWRTGNAIFYFLDEDYKFSLRRNFFSRPGWFRNPIWSRLGSTYTLAIEFSMGALVFVPAFRPWILAGIALLHFVLEITFSIRKFEFLMLITLILFLRDDEIMSVLNPLASFLNRL